MFVGVQKFLRDITTEDTAGKIFCYVRILSLLGGLVLLGIMIFQASADLVHFDLEKAGRSLLEYLTGVGAAIWGKTKSGA